MNTPNIPDGNPAIIDMERQLDMEFEYTAAHEHFVRSHQYFAGFASLLMAFDSHLLNLDTEEGVEARTELYSKLWFPIHQFRLTLQACDGACQEVGDLLTVLNKGVADQVVDALYFNLEDGLFLNHFTETFAHQLIADQLERDEDAFESAYLTSL